MFVFVERGKAENPGKKRSEKGELKARMVPGRIRTRATLVAGERFLPQRHPCSHK